MRAVARCFATENDVVSERGMTSPGTNYGNSKAKSELGKVAFKGPKENSNLARALLHNCGNSNLRDVIYEAIEVLGIWLAGKQTAAPRTTFYYVVN